MNNVEVEDDPKLLVEHFVSECSSIMGAAEFVHDAAVDLLDNVAEIQEQMKAQGLLQDSTATSLPWSHLADRVDVDTKAADELRKALVDALPRISQHLDMLRIQSEATPRPSIRLQTHTYRDTIRFLWGQGFPGNRSDVELTELKRQVVQNLSKTDEGIVSELDEESGLPWDRFVEIAAQDTQFRTLMQARYDTENLGRTVQHLISALHLPDPRAVTSPWRQSFIAVMARFDATVFDIVRIGFYRDFPRVLKAFAKKDEKILLSRLAELGTFEALRAEIVDQQLKSKYLRDLVLTLHSIQIPRSEEMVADEFEQLIEIISRRNVHLHARGVIDQKYFEHVSPVNNIYNLRLGDLATIDRDYFGTACTIATKYAQALETWVQH